MEPNTNPGATGAPAAPAETATASTESTGELHNARQEMRKGLMGAEEFIRENPIESALGAMGIGFLLAQFPLRYIVAGLVQLTLLLLKPAVLLYAAVKVLQDIRLRSDAGYTAHGQSERQ